jgi:hypothetical protein
MEPNDTNENTPPVSITLRFDEVEFYAGEGVFSLTARSGTEAERDIRAYVDSFGPLPSREEALEYRRRTASRVNDKKLALKTGQVTVRPVNDPVA